MEYKKNVIEVNQVWLTTDIVVGTYNCTISIENLT